MGMFVAVPIWFQVFPSGDQKALKTLLVRVRRTQFGAVCPATVTEKVEPAVLVRNRNSIPELGSTSTNACREFALSVSRIIKAALALPAVFCTPATRVLSGQFTA
jgi:hypothetical protein